MREESRCAGINGKPGNLNTLDKGKKEARYYKDFLFYSWTDILQWGDQEQKPTARAPLLRLLRSMQSNTTLLGTLGGSE